MRRLTKPVVIGLAALLSAPAAWGLEFRSVVPPKAVLYDAPSAHGKKLFIVSQHAPVEIIVNLGEWIKVRDQRGDLAWIEARQLASKRSVVITVPQAEVREAPDEASKLVFRVEKDVVLELVEAGASGWAKVRHRDGLAGFVQISKVWGL